jgi:hypothetical protein
MKMRKYERNTHVVRAARILCAVADRRRRGPPSAFETTDAQVKSLAKRQLVCSLAAEEHAGVYITVLDCNLFPGAFSTSPSPGERNNPCAQEFCNLCWT